MRARFEKTPHGWKCTQISHEDSFQDVFADFVVAIIEETIYGKQKPIWLSVVIEPKRGFSRRPHTYFAIMQMEKR